MVPTLFLSIAKNTLLEHFGLASGVDKESCIKKEPLLSEEGASFVTLHKDGTLHGCIGSIIAHRPLFDDLVSNTLSAAFHDPRFPPLKQEELSSLDIEVSVLTPPEEIGYDDYEDLCKKVVVGKDGLILQHGVHQGTFLPQVWEQLPNVFEFLEHLSYKAGSSPDIYALHPKILRYRVKAIEEAFDAIPPI
ncbi:MAG: AmmeMemoRadiSam system protein A [Helicobacteraceae bacterium]|nr:AmmeMemoRadiSam system protein A [Helicobacteraceae bacterium]